jgi:hypothetical protein
MESLILKLSEETAEVCFYKVDVDVMERSFAIEQAYYCLYVCLHLLYLCVVAE